MFAGTFLAVGCHRAEVRGTWLTTTANQAIASPARTASTMKALREIGLNTVYVECWKNGYTEFPSKTLQNSVGIPLKINPSTKDTPAVTRDLLRESLTEAHRNGLRCIAWFEYGFMAAYKDTHNELRDRRDWLSLNQQGGDVAKNGFVWLNPLHPDAQALLLGIILDAVDQYPDLDGIQLDDRLAWPSLEMGYDHFTKNLYAAEHHGQPPPTDIHDAEWCAWRQRKVTEIAIRLVTEIRKANPKLTLSLSPGPYPWCRENYLCDWPHWTRPGTDDPLFDEYVPQCYRLNYETFAASWQDQLRAMPKHPGRLIAGIRIVGDGPDLSWNDLRKSIEVTRQAPWAGGHVLWFSKGVLDLYPAELKSLYQK